MGRGLKLGLGIPTLIIGVIITLAGVGLMIVIGPDGSFTTPSTDIHADGAALVFDALTVRERLPQEGSLATTVGLDVTSSQGAVFVGVGPAAQVQAYLQGVPIDRVHELRWSNDSLQTDYRAGNRTPAPPEDQSFWDESDAGTGTRSIDWTISSGDWQVVIMNADGSPGLNLNGRARVHMEALGWISVTVLVVGLAMFIAGFILTVAGTRTPKKGAVAPGGAQAPAAAIGATAAPAPTAGPGPPPEVPPPPPSRPDTSG
jgi:hypothetical protein